MRRRFVSVLLICAILTGCSGDQEVQPELESKVVEEHPSDSDVDVEDVVDTVKDVKGLYDNFKLVKTGNSKKVLSGAVVDFIASGLSEDSDVEISDNFEYYDNCYINTGTYMDYTFGKFKDKSIKDGGIVTFDTTNFLFILGHLKDGEFDGWSYVYDLYTMDTLLVEYSEGVETGNYYELDADNKWVNRGSSSLDISETKNGCLVKSDKSQWKFNFLDNTIKFKSDYVKFEGNFLDFNVSADGIDYEVKAMGGFECSAGYASYAYYDTKDAVNGLSKMVQFLNEVDKSVVDVAADTAAGVVLGKTPLGILDTLCGGELTEELSEAFVEEYRILIGIKDERTPEERRLTDHRLGVRSEIVFDYLSFLISGKRPDKSLKNVPDDEKDKVITETTKKHVEEKNKRDAEQSKKIAEENAKKVGKKVYSNSYEEQSKRIKEESDKATKESQNEYERLAEQIKNGG